MSRILSYCLSKAKYLMYMVIIEIKGLREYIAYRTIET
jgi:hypothetical protein